MNTTHVVFLVIACLLQIFLPFSGKLKLAVPVFLVAIGLAIYEPVRNEDVQWQLHSQRAVAKADRIQCSGRGGWIHYSFNVNAREYPVHDFYRRCPTSLEGSEQITVTYWPGDPARNTIGTLEPVPRAKQALFALFAYIWLAGCGAILNAIQKNASAPVNAGDGAA